MPLLIDKKGRTFVQHPNGQTSHYIIEDFTDPWKARDTVLIQHGFGRNVEHWYHWIPALARQYRVIRRDLRGHGWSSYPTEGSGRKYSYDLDTILGEITDLLDQLEIDKVHFLGESTSGMLGEALAARSPDRLLSLTICSSPTHLPPEALQFFAFGHPSWPEALRKLGSRGWGHALSMAPGTVASSEPGYLQWWLDQVAQADGEGLAGYAGFLSTLDARPFLKDIQLPTLVLAPKNSAVMSVAQMEGLVKQIKNSQLELVDAPGHEIYVTGAEQCQNAVIKFWQSLKT